MPVSPWRNIGSVIEVIVAANPRSVLDIGVGNGKWGYLVREYIDVWQGRHDRSGWEVRIEGVEAYAPYIKDYQRLIYDEIHIGRAQDVVPVIDRGFDLILACDVIEHFSKAEAEEMIRRLHRMAGRALLLSIPIGPDWLRDSYNENPFEAHLSEWAAAEFYELGASMIQVSKIQDDRRDTALVVFPGEEWKLSVPHLPHGFFPFRTTFGLARPVEDDLRSFAKRLGAFLSVRELVQMDWTDAATLTLYQHDVGDGTIAPALSHGQTACIPLESDSAEVVFILGSIDKVDELSLRACIAELNRVTRRALWLTLQPRQGRERGWWLSQFEAGGFCLHSLGDRLPSGPSVSGSDFVLLMRPRERSD